MIRYALGCKHIGARFSLFLLICFLIICGNSSSTELKISVSIDSVYINDTITVDIYIDSVSNLFGAGFYLRYNSHQIRYLGSSEGPFINSNDNIHTIFLTYDEPEKNRIISGVTRSDYTLGGASTVRDTLLLSYSFEILVADSIPLTLENTSLVAPDGETEYEHNIKNSYLSSQIPTGINNNIDILPQSYEVNVSEAYPNPFNPSTTFLYEVNRLTRLSIDIYNIRGQRVRELLNKMVYPGKYEIEFDISGDSYSSGTYFVVFKTTEGQINRKILLLK